MTSDPDSLTDQSDSGMMEDKSERGDDSDSADESDSEVEEPLPLANEAQPQLKHPKTVVPEGGHTGDGD
jgi:hypothetical protein